MNRYTKSQVEYVPIPDLKLLSPTEKPTLPAQIYTRRVKCARQRMHEKGLDGLVIYADREHYANFRYFAGFDPRFEEALLVLHADGRAFALLGNECMGLSRLSSYPLIPVLCQVFSLPNQPMDHFVSMHDCLAQAGVHANMRIGVIGWKLLDPGNVSLRNAQCVPAYIVEALEDIVGGREQIVNATAMLISPEDGLRTINCADEIAEYEFGAATVSEDVMTAIATLQPGKSEAEIANCLKTGGRVVTCHPIVEFGENVYHGLVSPTDNRLCEGDEVSISIGLEGGMTVRNGYAAANETELGVGGKYFFNDFARQYFAAVAAWYEHMHIGITGGEIYGLIEELLPQKEYGWTINPGHLIANEEWLCSPIYRGSTVPLRSGMLVQMDIIPSAEGVCSPNMEDGICIADAELRRALSERHPAMYARMLARQEFMRSALNIRVRDEVLPLSNCPALYRPLLFNGECGFRMKK